MGSLVYHQGVLAQLAGQVAAAAEIQDRTAFVPVKQNLHRCAVAGVIVSAVKLLNTVLRILSVRRKSYGKD